VGGSVLVQRHLEVAVVHQLLGQNLCLNGKVAESHPEVEHNHQENLLEKLVFGAKLRPEVDVVVLVFLHVLVQFGFYFLVDFVFAY